MHTGTERSSVVDGAGPKLVRKSTAERAIFRPVARDLTPAENESARGFMRELLKQHDQNQSALAPKLGMVPSGISRFLAGRQGTSRATCERIAALLNVSVDEVLGHAPRSGAIPTAPDQYPERAKALARLRGILPAEVEERVRNTWVNPDRPFTERQWFDLALRRLREHEDALADQDRIVEPSASGKQ